MRSTRIVQVNLADQVDALIAAVPAYLLDPMDSHYCKPLAEAFRALMVPGVGK